MPPNNPYIDGKLIMSKENALVARRTYTKLIDNESFNIATMIKNDPEINFTRSACASSFLRYYKLAYSEYKKKNYFKSMKYIKIALGIRHSDSICNMLSSCIKRGTLFTSRTIK
jgi:hypothetical protein